MSDYLKRMLDMVMSALMLTLTWPLVAVCAAAIRMEDGGPAIFRQDRVGLRGDRFKIYKFRTMVVGADRGDPGVAADDARITRVGKVLRRFSLDELPQLVNVLKGDMSLVGPRPTLPYQVERYSARQRRRLEVRPGITGWAQINGRNDLAWSERIELDIWYVDHRSLWLDLRILVATVRKMLTREGTYNAAGETKLFDLGEGE